MKNSLDFWVVAPRGRRKRLGVVVEWTASSQLRPLESASEKPGSAGVPKRLCKTPLRKSASTRRMREPALAMVIARLAEVRDLPSFGTELVSRRVLGRCAGSAMYKREERRLR